MRWLLVGSGPPGASRRRTPGRSASFARRRWLAGESPRTWPGSRGSWSVPVRRSSPDGSFASTAARCGAERSIPLPSLPPLVLINAVGLTSRLLPLAPRLNALAQAGWCRSLIEVLPAVTCTAQASILTGVTPEAHGIVGNGWYLDRKSTRLNSSHLGISYAVF